MSKALNIIKGIEQKVMESNLIPIEEKAEIKKIITEVQKIPQVEPATWNAFQEKLDQISKILGKAPMRFYLEGKKESKPKY